ncbi:MAG: transposase [Pleurocapsa sp. MO_226.B13]|nr:transposase [Pleurocapsa sp. MO_226.B13]
MYCFTPWLSSNRSNALASKIRSIIPLTITVTGVASFEDVGISSLLTTSDGEKIANPKHFNKLYQKLKIAQKELSRKTKGSSNRYKARLKVARIHAKIKDARTDFLHKLTTELVRNNSLIAIENLAV